MFRKFLSRLCLLAAATLAYPAHATIDNPTIAEIDAVLAAVRVAYRAAVPNGNDRPVLLPAGEDDALNDDARAAADRLILAAFETRGERDDAAQSFLSNDAPQPFDVGANRPVEPRAARASVINRAARGAIVDAQNGARRLQRLQPQTGGLAGAAAEQARQIAALAEGIDAFGQTMRDRSGVRKLSADGIRPSVSTAARIAAMTVQERTADFAARGLTLSTRDTSNGIRVIPLSQDMAARDLGPALDSVERSMNHAAAAAAQGSADGAATVQRNQAFETLLSLADQSLNAVDAAQDIGRSPAFRRNIAVLDRFALDTATEARLRSGDLSLAALGETNRRPEESDYDTVPEFDNRRAEGGDYGDLPTQQDIDGALVSRANGLFVGNDYEDITDALDGDYDSETPPEGSSSSGSRGRANSNDDEDDDRSSSGRGKERAEPGR